MNTTASYSSEQSWSRRCSTETIFSIQGKETDVVCDTSDTEWCASTSDRGEYEPLSEPDDEAPLDSSSNSDDDIIATRVIAVSVGDDGELQLADGEQTASDGSDSEIDLNDYWHCAQCRNKNNNPLYRYCEKCFKVRKNFFPPRPKRRHRRKDPQTNPPIARTLSQDSGVYSAANSQELTYSQITNNEPKTDNDIFNNPLKRRRVESLSDPSLTIDETKLNSVKDRLDSKDELCIICCAEPKSGVFVHGRIAHICCCYKCAVKVWTTAKRCPVCNSKVSNVLKAVVM